LRGGRIESAVWLPRPRVDGVPKDTLRPDCDESHSNVRRVPIGLVDAVEVRETPPSCALTGVANDPVTDEPVTDEKGTIDT